MKIKLVFYIALAIIIIVSIGFFASSDTKIEKDENVVFHVTLADPKKYENGLFSDSFEIDEGKYEIRFVPNGDSPKVLKISINGEFLNFSEDFILEGTPHETGVSTYYTWKYLGNNIINLPNTQEVTILINPNGNLQGPVSIDIIKI